MGDWCAKPEIILCTTTFGDVITCNCGLVVFQKWQNNFCKTRPDIKISHFGYTQLVNT